MASSGSGHGGRAEPGDPADLRGEREECAGGTVSHGFLLDCNLLRTKRTLPEG